MKYLLSILFGFVVICSSMSPVLAQDFGPGGATPGTSVTPPTSSTGSTIYSGRFAEGRDAGRYSFSNVVNVIIPQAATWIARFLAALAVLFLIYAGFQYLTAGGEPEKISQATKTALYVLVGVILSMFAYAIVYLILTLLSPGT